MHNLSPKMEFSLKKVTLIHKQIYQPIISKLSLNLRLLQKNHNTRSILTLN